MSGNKGFDTISDLSSHGQQILDSGYSFVCRYYHSLSHSIKQKLTRSEALHLSNMGIYLVAVFENNGDHAEYFSKAQGESDGAEAFWYADNTIHQPLGTPIYFAVDFDASEDDLHKHIIPYFTAVRAAMPEFAKGVYGSGFICRRLLELGLVSHTWLAQSTGWAEYHEFDKVGKWNLKQLWSTTWHGLSVDPDISNGNGGGFKV